MEIVIHQINHTPKTSKNGNSYVDCGIKYRGKWYHGFGDEVTETWQAGNVVELDIWEEEYEAKDGGIKQSGKFVRIIPVESKTKPVNPNRLESTGSVEPAKGEEVQIEDLPF